MKKIVIICCLLLVAVCCMTACQKAVLATPVNLAYQSGILSWDEVPDADGYLVEVNGQEAATVYNANYVFETEDETTFRVRAIAEGRFLPSAYSETYVYKPVADTRTALSMPTISDINGAGEMNWTYVSNASGYRIWVNNNAVATVGANERYTLRLQGTGSFSVQVQAVGQDNYKDSPRSASYRVNVQDGVIAPPALRAPTIAFSAEHARLEWTYNPNAVGYSVRQNGVEIAYVAATDLASRQEVGNSYRYFYAVDLHVKNVQLTVTSVGDGEKYADSSPSNAIAFPFAAEKPPVNLRSDIIGGTLCFTWDALTYCLGYTVQLERDGALYDRYTVANNYLVLDGLPDGVYAASVRGVGDDYLYSSTNYSAQVALRLVGGALQKVVLDAPQHLYVYQKELSFSPVVDATAYQIWIDTPYDDEQGSYYYTVETTRFALPAALYESILTMYVRALGGANHAPSYWSEGVCYYPENENLSAIEYGAEEPKYPFYSVLAVPIGLYADGTTLRWTASSGAEAYELWVDGVVTTLTETKYTLDDCTVPHVCKVRAVTDAENVLDSPFGEETYASYPVVVPTPVNVTVDGTTLRWDNVGAAAGYQVQIGDTIYDSDAAMLNLKKTLVYDGTYTMRVRALPRETWQVASLWSESVTLTVDYEQWGTEHKPYVIASAQDLQLLVEHPTAYFVVSENFEVGIHTPLFSAQGAFAGNVDGRGHVLSGIALVGDDEIGNGFWGCLWGATLRNMTFEFASVSFSSVNERALLAAKAVNTVFDGIVVRTANRINADATMGVVGDSNGCRYTMVTATVDFWQEKNTAVTGGLAGVSANDRFEQVTINGQVSGGMYVGAICGTANRSAVVDCTVGAATPMRLATQNGYVGAVGKGSLSACSGTINVQATVYGNAYVGGFGGMLNCDTYGGTVTVAVEADCGNLYVGGLAGSGSLDTADAATEVSVTGSARIVYIGGAVGYAEGLSVFADTSTFVLQVDLASTEGRFVGGVVGFGLCTYTGSPEGTIAVGEGVSAGRIAGVQPSGSEEGWQVARRE